MRGSGRDVRAGVGSQSTNCGQQSVEHSFCLPDSTVGQVFDLFCDPRGLDNLTPSWFRLIVRDPRAVELRVGAKIDYRMRWRGLPLRWQSVITELERPNWLVYQQSRGPFRDFRHEHSFLQQGPETLVIDRIVYRSFGGRWMARALLHTELARILRFRERAAARALSRAQAISSSTPG